MFQAIKLVLNNITSKYGENAMVRQISPHINEDCHLQIALTVINDKGGAKNIITPPGTPEYCNPADASPTSAQDIYNHLCSLCPMACDNSSSVCGLSGGTNQLHLFECVFLPSKFERENCRSLKQASSIASPACLETTPGASGRVPVALVLTSGSRFDVMPLDSL